MKIKRIALLAAAFLISAGAAQAADRGNWDWNQRFSYDRESPRFSANEFTLDLFGTYGRGHDKFNDAFDNDLDDGEWGGGIGVNYFFTRNLGVGIDAFAQDDGGAFVNASMANVILRFPIDSVSIAPYIFGGAGVIFDPENEWAVDAGIGLEYRLNPLTGLFTDFRYVWPDDAREFSLLRAGIRFVF